MVSIIWTWDLCRWGLGRLGLSSKDGRKELQHWVERNFCASSIFEPIPERGRDIIEWRMLDSEGFLSHSLCDASLPSLLKKVWRERERVSSTCMCISSWPFFVRPNWGAELQSCSSSYMCISSWPLFLGQTKEQSGSHANFDGFGWVILTFCYFF